MLRRAADLFDFLTKADVLAIEASVAAADDLRTLWLKLQNCEGGRPKGQRSGRRARQPLLSSLWCAASVGRTSADRT